VTLEATLSRRFFFQFCINVKQRCKTMIYEEEDYLIIINCIIAIGEIYFLLIA